MITHVLSFLLVCLRWLAEELLAVLLEAVLAEIKDRCQKLVRAAIFKR